MADDHTHDAIHQQVLDDLQQFDPAELATALETIASFTDPERAEWIASIVAKVAALQGRE